MSTGFVVRRGVLKNRRMQEKLNAAECVDVSQAERTVGGDYLLEEFCHDVDYCDAREEAWIWSIGRLLRPLTVVMADGSRRLLPAGSYLASTTSRFYTAGESEVIECVFLR